ncbi:restriction endonuclease subunit S [Campylobacter sp. W0014]|uniref:restriction endonuclease subunit S n=1 Tax=Campylobacter sp. W0014 TaxID=2735781 RepID=UPI001ED15CAB|nr:restriction endonuclease subunit S [Campylobacter sp. W0014]
MKNFKNSGIEWLGEIPEHWEMVKGFFLFFSKKELNLNFQCKDRLALTLNGVIEKSISQNDGLNPLDFRTYQIFEKNDLVFKLIDLDNINTSRVGYVHKKGIMSSAYIRLISKNKNYPKYFYYYYYNLYIKQIFNNLGTGVRATLKPDELLSIKLCYPPLKEQEQIANFLDEKCEKIQNFIEKKEKLLSLLQEQKQALINETITKGLDKNVKLKNSGIEWLGEIPEHWEMVRLANFGIFLKGNGISRQDLIEDGEPAIHYGDIYTKYEISTTALKSRISTETAQNITSIHNGDILFAGSGETKEDIGKNIVYLGKEKAFAGGDVIIFRQRKNNALFLSYALNTKYVKFLKGIDSKGEIIVHIYASNLKDIKIPLPPLKEQEQIANFLDEKCEKIDSLIIKIKKQIELIKEYKTTLINEAVCGRMNL